MKKRQITIKDIAKALHISPSTVSRSLADHPDISQETKNIVNAYAREHKYKPNALALSLRTNNTKTIGVILPQIVHYFFSSVLSGIEDEAEKGGYRVIICQSNAKTTDLKSTYPNAQINPLGDWTGGTDVDTGATNRKLGSDMGDSVTGGGLHGKDLSKADVSVNIYAFLKAQETGKTVNLVCAIGDDTIDGKPYSEIVEIAREYIHSVGGFEKFAEWGLF